MKSAAMYKETGELAGTIDLPESYFGAPVRSGPVYYTVNSLLTNRRQGNASTKTRSQVNFSTAKPWRQKGTGRARAGMRSSPLWRKGGVVFGPHPKDYKVHLPKKVRRAALVSALSAKAAEDDTIKVVDSMVFDQPKTKRMAELLEKLDALGSRVLIMLDGNKPTVWKSARNLAFVEVKPFAECNAYDVLLAERIIIEKSAIEKLEQKKDEGSVPDNQAAAAD